MFCKLSVSNVKKSIQNYAIYFLTLTIAVCIFYVFNSIDALKNVLTVAAVTESFLSNMDFSMSLLSVFVTIVMAGLVLYANNFLVGRRKREFGIYDIRNVKNASFRNFAVENAVGGHYCSRCRADFRLYFVSRNGPVLIIFSEY